MELKNKIYSDIITAMKARESLKTDSLKMIKAEIMNHEVSSADAESTDEIVMQILKRAIKQRKEAAEGFEKGGKQEMADKELQEVEIYQDYLPEQMDEESIKKIVQEVIEETGASSPSDMGKVMGAVMAKTAGNADGNVVKEMVQKMLNE